MTGYDRKKYCFLGRSLMVLAGILAAVAVAWHLRTEAAVFRTEDAVHIDPAAIENATLAIGTHLIYLHAMNEQIYEIALDSAAASGQDKWYYKSELAGGMWVDISDAGTIEDITTAGKIVDDSEIQALYFTHHTKPDGITYDLKTNVPVCIFDIVNVYDLEYLPELESLKMQYDMMRESGSSTKTAIRNRNLIQDFFATQVRSDMTDRCDAQIQALQGYYNELVANGASSKDTQMVLKVMEKLDCARRAAVFSTIDGRLATLQNNVVNVADEDGELELDDNLLTAIGSSQYALNESFTEAQGNMLAKGETVLSETEYALSNSMIGNAEDTNYSGCDEQNWKLQYLDNISNRRIASRQEELELLEELIGMADVKYGDELSSGVTRQYTDLVSQRVSSAALQSRKREDMASADAARSELEFLIQGKVDRLESEDAQTFVLSKIQDTAKFRGMIRSDDYQQEYQDSVAAYVDWLNSLLSNLKDSGSSQSGEETIYEQKAALQEQKLQALDELDLDTAKRIDAQIADIDERILAAESASAKQLEELTQRKVALEKQLAEDSQNADLLAELGKLEAELADSQTNMPTDSQTSNIMTCKREILNLLAAGDTSDAVIALLENDIELLASMVEDGSALALEASKEVYQKLLAKSELEGVNAYQEFEDQIETAIVESMVHSAGNSGLSDGLSAQMAESVISAALGIDGLIDDKGNLSPELISSGGLSDEGTSVSQETLAAALTALGELCQDTGAEEIQALTQDLVSALSQTENSIVFAAVRQESESYAPAEKLALFMGYRYIWNDSERNAILSRGRLFYSFMAFDDKVKFGADEVLSMKHRAIFSGALYIPGSFVEEQFGCYIYDISGTDYSVLVNDKVVEKSQEILSELPERD